jgi:hypothetical protein
VSSSQLFDKHWLLSVHPHRPIWLSHTGLLMSPVQSVGFVDEHCVHWPTRPAGAEPLC